METHHLCIFYLSWQDACQLFQKGEEMPKTPQDLIDQGGIDLTPRSIGDCCVCHEPITDEHPDEVRRIARGMVHESCCYDALGEIIEEHPIDSFRIKR